MASISQKIMIVAIVTLLIGTHVNADSTSKLQKLANQCNQGDQKSCQKLAEIAIECKDVEVSVAAAQLLSNQSLLADVAKSARYVDVITAAAKQITDQALLTELAKNREGNAYLRVAVTVNLTDKNLAHEVLVDVAKKGFPLDLYRKVVDQIKSQITNQSELADLVIEASDEGVRTAALAKLTDQEQLVNIANNSKYSDDAIASLQKLTDENHRKEVAKDSKLFIVRAMASHDKNAKVEILSTAGKKGYIEIMISPEDGGKSMRLHIQNMLYEEIIVAINPGKNIFEFVQWQFGFIVPESGSIITLKPKDSIEIIFPQLEDMMVLSEGSLKISKAMIFAIGNIKFKKLQ